MPQPSASRLEAIVRATKRWQNDLVDTSGRNRLRRYRDLRTGTLDLTPGRTHGLDASALDRLLAGKPVSLSDLFPDYPDGSDDSAAFNDARRRLTAIHKVALTNLEEKGIETLFAAIGLATWEVDTGTPPNAPVVLLPLDVEATGAAASDFKIEVAGDAHLNPVLAHILRSEHDIETDDEEADVAEDPPRTSLEGFQTRFNRFEESWNALPNVAIELRCVAAIFSYSTMPLVIDLEQNGELFAENDIVAAIAGDGEAREALASRICDPAPNQPDTDPPSSEFPVLDADSSQHIAINRVLGGESLVIQGPPDTGKSQTIANLITALIARGKRVLFVAEKRAAIEAVTKRLEQVGLSDLVMDMHGGVTSRREFARTLNDSLERVATIPAHDYSALHRQLQGHRDPLIANDAALHDARDPWKLCVFEVRERVLAIPEGARAPMADFLNHNYTSCRCHLQFAQTATIVDTMIEREITGRLTSLFHQYPFVTVTGPRQSGKTTLCRAAFPNLEYANLEAPDQREFAETDPRGFLSQFTSGAILDEIQRVPALLSYLQVLADESGHNSLFVLTGSEQFHLSDAISQSLAGRTALLRLLPLSLAERERAGASNSVDDMIYSGFYPRIIDQMLNPRQALADYFETYVERDVRRLEEIRNLASFRRFVRLCAGRVGQLINLTSLGSDVGVSHTTAREWLTVLETSYIVFQLPPFHANIRKRLIRSPKLYFYDVGLASYLIGIEHADQVATHPLRGSLFENVVVAEALKHRFNRGLQFNLSFFRDAQGLECDLLYETGRGVAAIEAKSGSTIASDYLTSLNRVAELIPAISAKAVVYAGPTRQSRSDCEVVPLGELGGMLERLEVSQEVVAFVRDRMGPAPDDFDLEMLDAVYRTHIRPTLDGLESICRPLANQLFRDVRPSFSVRHRPPGVDIGGLLEDGSWEMAKDQYVVTQGFKLNDSTPLELKHIYRFQGHTGRGRNDFNINLAVEWKLGSEGFSRRVTLDEGSLPELEDAFTYSELDTRSGDADRVAAEITVSVMREIDRLSNE